MKTVIIKKIDLNNVDAEKKVIDFDMKGNVIRLFIGTGNDYWGDDWDDAPYEHNAGQVYDEYVTNILDFCVDFDTDVLEPCSGAFNSPYSKESMKNRDVPCLIFVPYELKKKRGREWCDSFDAWVNDPEVKKIYFGDKVSDVLSLLNDLDTQESCGRVLAWKDTTL